MMFLLLGKQEKKKDEEDQVGRLLRTSRPKDFLASVNLKGDVFSAITKTFGPLRASNIMNTRDLNVIAILIT